MNGSRHHRYPPLVARFVAIRKTHPPKLGMKGERLENLRQSGTIMKLPAVEGDCGASRHAIGAGLKLDETAGTGQAREIARAIGGLRVR